MKKPCIEIQQLSLQYKGTDFKAIDQLDLCIAKGEVFGLLGPNGAGKTSLISMLSGLINPDKGKILIEGENLSEYSLSIQKKMGIVPQEYALYPKLSAKENLLFFGRMYGVYGRELYRRVDEGIEKMGLTKFTHKKIQTFSGGMKRRINLLAGVLHKPSIIFLDEPTVGVDVQSKQVIMTYLHQLNQEGTTIIFSSHLLHQAQNFCTRIGILDNGKIQVEGATQDILMYEGKIRSLEEIFVAFTTHKKEVK